MDGEREAKELSHAIVRERLAACVQTFPIHSVYWWKSKLLEEPEYLVLAKTQKKLVEELIPFIKEKHTYEVPQIVVTPIEGGFEPYLEWIKEETDKRGG